MSLVGAPASRTEPWRRTSGRRAASAARAPRRGLAHRAWLAASSSARAVPPPRPARASARCTALPRSARRGAAATLAASRTRRARELDRVPALPRPRARLPDARGLLPRPLPAPRGRPRAALRRRARAGDRARRCSTAPRTPWLCRAGEMLFRRQRVSSEGGKVLAADAATIEVFAETGGFGAVGRLLRQQNTPTPAGEDGRAEPRERRRSTSCATSSTASCSTSRPGGEGAAALARVLERWVAPPGGRARSRSSRARASTTSAGAGTWASTSTPPRSSTRSTAARRSPPEELERLVAALPRSTSAIPREALAEMAGGPSTWASPAAPTARSR